MSFFVFFFKQKTAYEMRISDWSSDVCSSDLFLQRRLYPTDWRQTPPSVRPADPFSMARTQRRERADLSQRVARPHAHLSRSALAGALRRTPLRCLAEIGRAHV